MVLDFRSIIIGEIALDLADGEDECTDGEYYVLVCEECKKWNVTPPTTEEWEQFSKFIRWHTEVIDKMMREQNR